MNSETPSQPLNENESPAKDIAEQLLERGRQEIENNKLEAALESCQAALAIYQDIKDRFGEACTFNNLGNLYQEQAVISYSEEILKEFDNTQEKASSDLENSVISKPNWFIPGVNGNISIYSDFKEGSQPVRPPITDPPSKINVADRLLEKSRQLYENKKFASALKSCQEVLTVYREINDRLGEACTVNNVGNIYQVQAAESYSQALAIFRELGNEAGEKETKENLEQPLKSIPNWFTPGAGETILIVRGSNVGKFPRKPPIVDPSAHAHEPPITDPSNVGLSDPSNIA